jgi:hypothetical protein
VALNLQANFWDRLQHPDLRGTRPIGGGKKGDGVHAVSVAALQMDDAAHRAAGRVPWWIKNFPDLRFVCKKTIHFLNDYFHRDFRNLGWPRSDGKHKELTLSHHKNALLRLCSTEVRDKDGKKERGEFVLYRGLALLHRSYGGAQLIRSTPEAPFHGFNRCVSMRLSCKL